MRNYFLKRPSGAPRHTLSKLHDVPVGFVTPPPYLEAMHCFKCSTKGGCCSISNDLLVPISGVHSLTALRLADLSYFPLSFAWYGAMRCTDYKGTFLYESSMIIVILVTKPLNCTVA